MEREIIKKLDYIITLLENKNKVPDILNVYLEHTTVYDFLDKSTQTTYEEFKSFAPMTSDITIRNFNDMIKSYYDLKIVHTTKKGEQLYIWKRN